MSPAAGSSSLAARVRTPENASILTAVAIGIPTAGATQLLTDWVGLSFLLLIAVAVTVPTTYRSQWPSADDSLGFAIGWTVLASVVVAVALLGFAFLLRDYGGMSEATASAVAFLIVGLGGPALLSVVLGRRDATA